MGKLVILALLALVVVIAGCSSNVNPQPASGDASNCESLRAEAAAMPYEKDLCYSSSLAYGKQVDCSKISLPTLKQYCILKESDEKSGAGLELFDYCTGHGFKVDNATFDRSSFELLGANGEDANKMMSRLRDDMCGRFRCTNVTSYPCGGGRPSTTHPYVRDE